MPNKGYMTVWNGADVLSFYGAVLAALGGIVGVFFTVKHSQKQYREDMRLRIMPFLSIDKIDDNDFYKVFVNSNSEEFLVETNWDNYLITYSVREGTLYPKHLSVEQVLNIAKDGNRTTEVNGKIAHFKKHYCFLPLKITNVGNGVALKTQIGLFSYENGKYEKPDKERKYSVIQTIPQGQSVCVGIYWDLNDEDAITTYKLDILCSDISRRRYLRSIEYKFERNASNQFTITRIDTGENNIYAEFDQM